MKPTTEVEALRWLVWHYSHMGSNGIGMKVALKDLDPIKAVNSIRESLTKDYGRSVTDEALIRALKVKAEAWMRKFMRENAEYQKGEGSSMDLAVLCCDDLELYEDNTDIDGQDYEIPQWLSDLAEQLNGKDDESKSE